MKTRVENPRRVKRVRPVRASGLKLSMFARRLLNAWRSQLPLKGVNIVVAVSGSADSTALLLAMHELIVIGHLKATLTVAHLDHRLRQQSREDAKWVAKLANQLGYEIAAGRVDVKKRGLATGG